MNKGDIMSKKKGKLISVLGARNYITVNYDEFDECEYIQEALIRKYKDELSEVLIFATEAAQQKNWNEYTYKDRNDKKVYKMGLKKKIDNIIEEYDLDLEIKLIDIPAGFSEEELWEIFNIFTNEINEGDEIYFDVTHGFRYLAMLMMNILNYVKLSKNAEVKSIEYGLFEQLGPAYEVAKLPLEDRNARILDLTSFDYLNDWVVGVDNFINTGDADKINNLSGRSIGKMFAQDESMDDQTRKLINKISKLIKSLKYFNDEIKTARGNKLNNTILNILTLLDEIEEFETDSNNRISPLLNLIDKIKNKFSIFDKNDKKGLKNYFQLLKWCKEHKLVQQGLVIFRENMISTIADEINEPYLPKHMKDKDYDYTLIEIRDEIGNALYSLIEEDQEYNPITSQEKFDFIRKGIKENFSDFLALYDKFRYKRNDVSHFGLSENSASQGQKVIDNFDNYTDELQKLLEGKY
jgi:CRISPR-associated Csx2 family protein